MICVIMGKTTHRMRKRLYGGICGTGKVKKLH
jgi:hypothetical protein